MSLQKTFGMKADRLSPTHFGSSALACLFTRVVNSGGLDPDVRSECDLTTYLEGRAINFLLLHWPNELAKQAMGAQILDLFNYVLQVLFLGVTLNTKLNFIVYHN